MAGVGFELRKLFREPGIWGSTKAFAFSAITTVGPMVLCILMIFSLLFMMDRSGAMFKERELFLATAIYAFIFSVLITGGMQMMLSRFIADKLYEGDYEILLPTYYGAAAICLPIGGVAAWWFLSGADVSTAYKVAAYLLFAELIVMWLQTVLLSALKEYKRITANFAVGAAAVILGAWLCFLYTPYHDALAALVMMDIGLFLSIFLVSRHFEQTFPKFESRNLWTFLSYIPKYPSLLLIGIFVYSGVYVHSFVYWLGPKSELIADAFRISTFYDTPVFFAYLSAVPTLVTFVVSVETTFYEKFRDYYDKIIGGGTLHQIERAKHDMQRTLMHEISFLMGVQLLFSLLSLAVGIKLLPSFGMTMAQLDVFKLLVPGYFLFIITFVLLLLLLYYDDRKGVLLISGSFVLLNGVLTQGTMMMELDGFGLFLASLAALIAALMRMIYYVRNIDYYTFCSQPITVTAKKPKLWERLRKKGGVTAVLLLGAILLSACTNEDRQNSDPLLTDTAIAPAVTNTDKFVEDKRIYARDDDLSVVTLYLTVLPNENAEKPITWYGMNRIRDEMEEGELKVIVQEGSPDGSGPKPGMFGYGATEANGKIRLRGNTARYASQRSYRISLSDHAGLWHDQKVINLNKHIYDPTRIRQKLSFDLFETLPDIASLRTQFVHVFVRDLSEKGMDKGFEDYGLFTHVEQPNKNFLKTHWLDPNGHFYKAEFFEFYRYPEILKDESDPTYDKALFETHLEIRGMEDHDKLLRMLDDVNNYSIPIDEVVAKHFDLDNYLTFLAANILMDNMDTDAHNFLLYSPLNSDKWYFIPWDYDGGWELQRSLLSISPYANGISDYWAGVLHNRFFRTQEHVDLLKNKIDELYASAINGGIKQKVEAYRKVVEPFLHRYPDRGYLPVALENLSAEFELLSSVPQRSMQRFIEDLEKPKPFYMGDFEQVGDIGKFRWDHSFDLQGDDLYYDWYLSKDPAMTRIIMEKKNLTTTYVETRGLAPGTYYWKVVVRDSKGNQQISFDQEVDDEGEDHYGVRKFEVK